MLALINQIKSEPILSKYWGNLFQVKILPEIKQTHSVANLIEALC